MAHVLIIEDNADNLELMTYLLDHFGHTTTSAPDGILGIAAAIRELPDLIVCDIHLPGADGYQVARDLKSNSLTTAIPLIAVTALAMVGDHGKVRGAGFDSYMSKPIDPQRFVADLESFLPAPRARAPTARHEESGAQLTPKPWRSSVLIVDDMPTNRELMRETLEPFGFEVRLADSVSRALDMLRDRVPNLIVSDLHMPGADGFSFVRAVKADAELAKVPLILLSSSTWNSKERETALKLGVSRFLVRPIEPLALIDEIERCLGAGT